MANKTKIIVIFLVLIMFIVLMSLFSAYVYIGTYVFPIAPYWVTQLPPNPPKPNIKYGEFSFTIEYEIFGQRKKITDTLICEFDGFEVVAVGDGKKRKWKEYYKNEQGREVFTFRNEPSDNTKIVLENIDKYKVVLGMGTAEYYMNEPEYRKEIEVPAVQVYNTQTRYFLYPEQQDELFNEYGFKILSCICDKPIENYFR